jgi:hypothetical protein
MHNLFHPLPPPAGDSMAPMLTYYPTGLSAQYPRQRGQHGAYADVLSDWFIRPLSPSAGDSMAPMRMYYPTGLSAQYPRQRGQHGTYADVLSDWVIRPVSPSGGGRGWIKTHKKPPPGIRSPRLWVARPAGLFLPVSDMNL